MAKPRIAVIVGSNRRGSFNRILAGAIVRLGEDRLAFETSQIFDLPMFNQDLEADLPAPARRLKAEIEAADGILVVTPEHNRSIPAVLKNAIDWGARPAGQMSWAGKPIAIAGTSPGSISSAIAQQHLRQILGDIGALVMGGEVYVNYKPELFGEDGEVANDGTRKFLSGFIGRFADLVTQLRTATA
jgi:chromate reductase, NAD(P)H dehydrogenase (quinone)